MREPSAWLLRRGHAGTHPSTPPVPLTPLTPNIMLAGARMTLTSGERESRLLRTTGAARGMGMGRA